MKHHTQSGNALWFILIAVILLGGLTILMTRSSNTSDDSGDYERVQIQISEMVRFAKSMELATANLISRKCSEKSINFDTPELTGYDNTSAPTDNSCDIFSDKGAGMAYKELNKLLLDQSHAAHADFGKWVISGDTAILDVGGTGSTNSELLLIAPFVTKDLCLKLNGALNITNPAGSPPSESGAASSDLLSHFTGTFGSSATINGGGTLLRMKKSGCTKASDGDTYVFFHTLIAR